MKGGHTRIYVVQCPMRSMASNAVLHKRQILISLVVIEPTPVPRGQQETTLRVLCQVVGKQDEELHLAVIKCEAEVAATMARCGVIQQREWERFDGWKIREEHIQTEVNVFVEWEEKQARVGQGVWMSTVDEHNMTKLYPHHAHPLINVPKMAKNVSQAHPSAISCLAFESPNVLSTSSCCFHSPFTHLTSAHPVNAKICRITIESKLDLAK